MLSKAERDYLSGRVMFSGNYSRILRWRIRHKAERMKAELELIYNSGILLNKKKRVEMKPKTKFPFASSHSLFNKREKEERGYSAPWPPSY